MIVAYTSNLYANIFDSSKYAQFLSENPTHQKWAFFAYFLAPRHQGATLDKFCWRIIRVGLWPFIIRAIGYLIAHCEA